MKQAEVQEKSESKKDRAFRAGSDAAAPDPKAIAAGSTGKTRRAGSGSGNGKAASSVKASGRRNSRTRKRSLGRLGEFIGLTARHFTSDKCGMMASSIVYTTLISLVPFLTFILSVLSIFRVFDTAVIDFQDLLVAQFGEATGTELGTMLSGFIANAGRLGAAGLASFLITSIILINRVWIMINQIYQTPMNGSNLARFARFMTILIVGTLLFGAYLSVSSLFSRWVIRLIGTGMLTQRIFVLVGDFGPWLLIWLLFFLLIFAVPSTRVKVSSALLGSVIGTLVFQLANTLFSRFVIGIINYSVIYGSLASLLVMLFWVYVLWLIIFGAVEIAYVHQYRPGTGQRGRFGRSAGLWGADDSPARQLADGIDIMLLIAGSYRAGQGPVSVRMLGRRLGIPDRQLFRFLELFVKRGYIVSVDRGGRRFVPAKPLESVGMTEVLGVLFGTEREPDHGGQASLTGTENSIKGSLSAERKTVKSGGTIRRTKPAAGSVAATGIRAESGARPAAGSSVVLSAGETAVEDFFGRGAEPLDGLTIGDLVPGR